MVLPLRAATQFVLILDATDLGFAPSDLSWVANAYTLLFGGFSLSLLVSTLNGPRLAARFGSRQTMVAAMAATAAGLGWFGFLSPMARCWSTSWVPRS